MNCIEFRRNVLTHPAELNAECRTHRDTCPPCAAYAERVIHMDRQLHDAFAVNAPKELVADILVAQHLGERRSRWDIRWFALAASVLLAATLLFTQWPQTDAFSQQIAEHLSADPLHLVAQSTTDRAAVAQMVADMGGQLQPDRMPAPIHATGCVITGKKGLHLVLQGRHGLVTAFLLPAHPSREAPATLHLGQQEGTVLPAQRGVIVVVGEPNEPLDAIGHQLDEAIVWGI
ncbi:MAG: DUF3379 family protein [Pseudomonadota bacterium]|nr:DUF3379 family protein [Pseudomonadota bacterium]